MSQTFSLQKSREELKRQGYDTDITEMPWSPYTKRRKDLYNLFDVVGIRDDVGGVTGVQACGEDMQGHVHKVLEGYTDAKGNQIPPNPHIAIWLRAGNKAFIWSWCLRGAKGRRKMYRLREIEFRLKDGVVVAEENPHVQESPTVPDPSDSDVARMDSAV